MKIRNLRDEGRLEEIFSESDLGDSSDNENGLSHICPLFETNSNSQDLDQCKDVQVKEFMEDDGKALKIYPNSQGPSSNINLPVSNRVKTYYQQKFAFSNLSKPNLNEHITKELEKVLQDQTKENNIFNVISYRKIINLLKGLNEKITSYEQVKNFKVIGSNIARKVIVLLKNLD